MKTFKKSTITVLTSSIALGGFNAESFLSTVTEAVTQDTVIPHPEGDFEGNIDDFKLKDGTSKSDGKVWVRATAKIRCLDKNAVADSGLDDLFVYDEFFLDLTDEGGLDMGGNKNVSLGRMRTATGLNVEGEEFSLNMLKNTQVGYTVKHRLNDQGEPRAYVSSVYAPDGDDE